MGLENGIIEGNNGFLVLNNIKKIEEEKEEERRKELESRKIIKYTIKEGDTLSKIASSFNLKVQTILWSNNLGERSILQVNQTILVPPKNGIIYKIKRGDTLEAVARKYKSNLNEIIEWNQLNSSDNLSEEQEIFLPGGKMPPPPKPRINSKPKTPKIVISHRAQQGCRRFPYGWCTWYVAQKRCVPWSGDAKMWLTNAQAYGYSTGKEPAVGSIMVTTESRWGHVAYVEEINGDLITISEMNKYGWGISNKRTLHRNDRIIRGYIY